MSRSRRLSSARRGMSARWGPERPARKRGLPRILMGWLECSFGPFVEAGELGLEFGEAVVEGAISGLVGVEDFGFVFVEFFKEAVEVVIETGAQGFEFAGEVAAGFVEFGLGDELGVTRFAAKELQAKAGEAEKCGQGEDHLAGEQNVGLGKHGQRKLNG